MTKKDELLAWCKSRGEPFSSVDVNNFGSESYYLRARRTIQDFAADPFIPVIRIPDMEARLRGLTKEGKARLAFYEISA